MITQTFYLKKWDWYCKVFYEVTPYDYEDVCVTLADAGCDEDVWRDAKILILEGNLNTGLTYSNLREGVSVMVICKTTGADEFQSTFDHEKGHLAMHISDALGIEPFSEEYQYLAGEIGRILFKKARVLLCEECRAKAGL